LIQAACWDYYAGEDYTSLLIMVLMIQGICRLLIFTLKKDMISLLYAGRDTDAPFLGGFSGNIDPVNFSSPSGAFTLKFRSDALNNAAGWMAVYHDGSFGINDQINNSKIGIRLYPNPAKERVDVMIPGGFGSGILIINDLSGQIIQSREIYTGPVQETITIDVADWPPGIYSLRFTGDDGLGTAKLIVKIK
jgi:hypothetical protein